MGSILQGTRGLRAANRKSGNKDPIHAVVAGDATGNYLDPVLRPGKVYVSGDRVVGWVNGARTGLAVTPGLHVLLEYDEYGRWYISRVDGEAELNSGSDPNVTSVPPRQTMTQDMLETLRVSATGEDATVTVKSWVAIVDRTAYQFSGSSIDLTSLIPDADEMCYVVVFVGSDFSTLEAYASTPRSLTDIALNIDDIQECIDQSSLDSTPVWAIPLADAQSTIDMSDIQLGVDLRNLVNNTITGGTSGDVSGPGTSTDRAIATWNGTDGRTLRNNANATIDASGNLTAASLISNGNITQLSGSNWRPTADSTTALGIANAAGTNFVTFDTTNQKVILGTDAYLSRSAANTVNIDRFLYINGPSEGLGLGQIQFGANVDIQSNVANTGFTVGADSGTLVVSYLRRDIFAGTGTIAYFQGEGINASGSSYIGGTFEFTQIANTAGAETAQIRITTMNAGARTERWRITQTGTLLAAGSAGGAVGSASLPYISRIADPDTGIWWPNDNIMAISSGGTETIRFDASQNVQIGASGANTARLNVNAAALGVGVIVRSNAATTTVNQEEWQTSAGTVRFAVGPNEVASAAGATLRALYGAAQTITVTGSTNITNATGFNFVEFGRPTISAASALTITNSATLYIANSPLASGAGPATITNAYALWVDDGKARFDGFIEQITSFSTPTAATVAFNQAITFAAGATAISAAHYAMAFTANVTGSGGSSTGIAGIVGESNSLQTAGTITQLTAASLANRVSNAGNVTIAVGAATIAILSSTGNLTTWYGFQARTPSISGGGAITNAYGFYAEAITGATNNYAIYTNAGLVLFNAGGDANSDVRIQGDTDVNLFFTDASVDRVGIGTNAPSDKFSVAAKFDVSANGIVTKYNNIATEGYGVPAIVDVVSLTGQTANIASTNVSNGNVAGLYRISAYLEDTTADALAGTLVLTFTWTDDVGSTTRTLSQILAATGRVSDVFFVRLASGSIAYDVTVTGIFGTAVYAVHFEVERVN